MPIQVFSSFSGPICAGAGEDPCVLSYASDQVAALEYVLDLAETAEGWSIIEVGATSCCGLYKCDMDAFIEALGSVLAGSA